MVAVPLLTPVTSPELLATLATEMLLLVQVPPLVASESPNVAPWQTGVLPLIADGIVFTVIIAVATQPLLIR